MNSLSKNPNLEAPPAKTYDVIVVGAGMSGLTCARQLTAAGLSVLVVEARAREGGRMHTVFSDGSTLPIELGAEFIHGAQPELLNALGQLNEPFYDVCDKHHLWQKFSLKPMPDFFEKMGKVLNAQAARGKDTSVEDFLNTRRGLSATSKKMFLSFVEGFEAADAKRISRKDLAQGLATPDPELNGTAVFRTSSGYGAIARKLSQELKQKKILHFNLALKKISWQKHKVRVTCHALHREGQLEFLARSLVVTVPLGVLKRPATDGYGIEWSPRPPVLDQAIAGLEMGHVQRIVFRFDERFWEHLERRDALSFVHLGPEHYFPTWWNLMPVRSTDLVAWQGGPKAQEMSFWSKEAKIRAALNTLSLWSGISPDRLAEKMRSCHSHDWSRDPFAHGAYSYVGVDGEASAQSLRQPIDDTVYFAGEACAEGAARGTVHGALESGLRVSQNIIESLNRNSRSVKNAKEFSQPRQTEAAVSRAEANLSGHRIQDRTAPSV